MNDETEKPEKRRRVVFSDAKFEIRDKKEKVRTARKRTVQSARWLERQLNDPYVKRAKAEGWRSRAAFKMIEIDDEYKLIKKDSFVLDLGVAPGGWAQVAMKRGAKKVVGVDLLNVEPIEGVDLLVGDFTDTEVQAKILEMLGNRPNLIISDMAANTVGHRETDHIRTIALAQSAADFAIEFLIKGGSFVAKVFQGGSEGQMLTSLKHNFKQVRHFKPKSSRAESVELYLIAIGKK
jgi:23S rRNA (uridine2552-2'-O)-methyltransferase